MIRFAFVLFAILVLTGASAAQDTNCAIDAWVEHRDPRGLNVRAKPDLKAKIVGKLRYDNGDDNEIVMVINTVEDRRNAIADSRAIRTSALQGRVTTFTTIAGAAAAAEGMACLDNSEVISLQEMHAALKA